MAYIYISTEAEMLALDLELEAARWDEISDADTYEASFGDW